MNSPKQTAPLAAWLIALLMIVPIPLALIAPVEFFEPAGLKGSNDYHYRYDLQQFLTASETADATPKGVMLAMSGGSCATVGPLRLSSDGVAMYVAFYPDATLGHFRGLVDDIVRGKPDFVVLQSSVLVLDNPPERIKALYAAARSYWAGQFLGLATTLGLREANDVDDMRWRCAAVAQGPKTWEGRIATAMQRIRPFSQSHSEATLEFLQPFFAANIPVLIVDTPANTVTAEYKQRMFAAATALLQTGPPQANLSLHQQPGLTPDDQFKGLFHLSPDASRNYRNWLNSEIVGVLEEQQDR